jgi:hypothetical protein
MDLIILILVFALVGFLTYLVITYVPMPPAFKIAIQVLVVMAIILFLLRRFPVPNVL